MMFANYGRKVIFYADFCYNVMGDGSGRIEKSKEHSL